ncbi:MAG TPA: kelch repeat-containing protein [Bacteroidia bacterium]|nr:kelch repeat-containing protein [Bacteroidia bacterium]
MKKIITSFVYCFLFSECFSQAGMWTWMKGDSIYNQPGNFGTQGVPSPSNNPPGFYEAAEWTDLQGNFWLFGGLNSPSGGAFYGDLWKFEPLTNNWTLMKGTGIVNDPGNYGTIGVPALSNLPSSRGFGCATWVDLNGDLWLFGGGLTAYKNDLWKYNIATNMWTWVHGSAAPNISPVYGTQGIPSINNTPGGRTECSANWVDNNGDLWLFGGDLPNAGDASDLWRYTISTNEWAWMKGPNIGGQPGVYGTMGIEDPSNVPGGRWVYCSWTDSNDKFWLFGGSAGFINTNDMWYYDPLTNNWTWKSGSNQGNNPGVYGPLCSSSINYVPGARYENRARWTTSCGKFWLYGGNGSPVAFSDLWYFDPLNLEWTLVEGLPLNPLPVYGSIGVPGIANTPGRRGGTNSWLSTTGELYLFGGYVSVTAGTACGNDLWKYTVDTACTGSCVTTGFEETNPPEADELLVFPNPANSSFTISFTLSEKQIVELRIYNTLGEIQLFQSFRTLEKLFEKEINVERLSDGIYFLQLKTKERNLNRKVIISH